ncbi:MAG: hypothetical protein FJ302_08155 [Planctomycetes bacterium]|nr:hypothetical protein [Planctomycetota bacterium]
MKGLIRGMMVAGCVAGLAIGFSGTVEARPNYKKAFDANYDKVAKENKTTCNVCHEGEDKKQRNNYGQALTKNIGKMEKDEAKIKEAFTKTEKEKSAVADKTFGDLLKDGKLPASK